MKVKVQLSTVEEAKVLKTIFSEEDVLRYFPMQELREVEDAVHIWEIFCKQGASLTAFVEEEPCGIAFLNLQPYKKLHHQCLITIIVGKEHRNKGVGTKLLEELFILAKEGFQLEMIHLEVYATNPAIRLYRKVGFEEFGIHKTFIKEHGQYIPKIFMQRFL